MIDVTQFPDVAAAEARLTELEQSDAAPQFEMREQVDSPEQQPAPEAVTTIETSPDSLPADTQATAETTPPPQDKVEDTQKGSKFAKDAVRRDTSWKALNTEKETFRKQQEEFTAQQQAFVRQQEQAKIDQAKKSQSYTPEQYEEGAKSLTSSAEQMDLQADGLEKRAENLESDGKYAESEKAKGEANRLRHKAIANRGKAEDAKEMAEHVRKNPEPTLQQVNERRQKAVQHFGMEAAKKWPDLVKPESEFYKTVDGHLRALAKSDPDLASVPSTIYHAARLVAAETAAARVPELEKKQAELQAKVKELEALTTPSNTISVTKLPEGRRQMTDDEELESLRAEAMSR